MTHGLALWVKVEHPWTKQTLLHGDLAVRTKQANVSASGITGCLHGVASAVVTKVRHAVQDSRAGWRPTNHNRDRGKGSCRHVYAHTCAM